MGIISQIVSCVKLKLCARAGQHGAVGGPGGGERGVGGGGFQTQPAALLQGRPGLEHAAAQLGGHGGREQVGLSASVASLGIKGGATESLTPPFPLPLSTARSWPWPVRTGCCLCSLPAAAACFRPSSWPRPCQPCTAPPTSSWFSRPERCFPSGWCSHTRTDTPTLPKNGSC